MTTNRIFSDPRPTFFLADGVTPNAFGKIFFYEPGAGNTTPKPAYSNADKTTALTHPYKLNGAGQPTSDIILDGDYRVVITDRSGEEDEHGNIMKDTPHYQLQAAQSQFEDWSSVATYRINEIVRGSDGNYWRSLVSANKSNDPTTTTNKWVKIFFISEWSSLSSYVAGDRVLYSNREYTCLVANSNKQPNTNRTEWKLTETQDWYSDQSYAANDNSYYAGILYRCILASAGDQPDTSPTNWVSVAADPDVLSPPVAGYLRSGFTTYLEQDGGFSGGILLSSVLTNAAIWETIGPTGSGADFIWTDLDNIPTNAKSILVRVNNFVARSAGADSDHGINLWNRPYGSSVGTSSTTLVSTTDGHGGTTITSKDANITSAFPIPIDSDRIIEFAMLMSNNTTETLIAVLVGYQA